MAEKQDPTLGYATAFVLGMLLGSTLTFAIASLDRAAENDKAIGLGYKYHDAKTGQLRWKQPAPATIIIPTGDNGDLTR